MKSTNLFTGEWKTVPIVMAFDPGFLLPSAVTMLSVMENGDKNKRYHFYILTEQRFVGMDLGLFDRIRGIFPNFLYEYVVIENHYFSETRLPMHVVSNLCFARLLLAAVVPSLEYCIYLDGDLIVRKDIGLLQQSALEYRNFNNCYMLAAPDLSLQNGKGTFFELFRKRLQLDNWNHYFNSGVMVMNLRKLREDHMLDRFQLHTDKEYFFGDQDILNVCCSENVEMLPVRWNMFPGNIGDETMLRRGCTEQDKADIMNGNAAILHFAGVDKPWKCIETVWEHEWYQYACRLPEMPLTEEYLGRLRSIDRYDSSDDRTDAVRDARRYLLYGYTDISRKLLDRLIAREIGTPWCFCDSNPEKIGKRYRDVVCVSWETASDEMDKDTVIILCAQNAWKEIRRELVQDGVPASQMIRYRKRDFALVSCEEAK